MPGIEKEQKEKYQPPAIINNGVLEMPHRPDYNPDRTSELRGCLPFGDTIYRIIEKYRKKD